MAEQDPEHGKGDQAQAMSIAGIAGVRFAVWAPNARRVSVVGDFNDWDGRRAPMRKRIDSGLWEIFIPEIGVRVDSGVMRICRVHPAVRSKAIRAPPAVMPFMLPQAAIPVM